MPFAVLAVTAAFAVPALTLGVRMLFPKLPWEQRRRPLHRSEVLDRLVAAGVRLLIVVALLLLAVIAIVGSVAAIRGDVPIPDGVVATGVGAVMLSVLTLATFGRPGR